MSCFFWSLPLQPALLLSTATRILPTESARLSVFEKLQVTCYMCSYIQRKQTYVHTVTYVCMQHRQVQRYTQLLTKGALLLQPKRKVYTARCHHEPYYCTCAQHAPKQDRRCRTDASSMQQNCQCHSVDSQDHECQECHGCTTSAIAAITVNCAWVGPFAIWQALHNPCNK